MAQTVLAMRQAAQLIGPLGLEELCKVESVWLWLHSFCPLYSLPALPVMQLRTCLPASGRVSGDRWVRISAWLCRRWRQTGCSATSYARLMASGCDSLFRIQWRWCRHSERSVLIRAGVLTGLPTFSGG